MNTLYYGDNLAILRQYIPSESIDLIYLDPPFNSNRNYNVLFKEESGKEAEAQITAFEDTWHWNQLAEKTYQELVTDGSPRLSSLISALRQAIGTNQMMAYLVMMAVRLEELHRVLKPTGSLYLHCDPTASHYLRIVLDAIFGVKYFQNEIVWKRTSAHNDPKKYGKVHDVILYYSKTADYFWNPQYTPYSQAYIDAEWHRLPSGRFYKAQDMTDPRNKMAQFDFMGTTARWRTNYEGMMKLWNAPQTEVPNSHGRVKLGKDGRPILRCRITFMDELLGVPLQSWWDDIISLRGGANERLGYPTQKPVALLERIIQASSDAGDLVLDPFCGCGTTIAAAQNLGRRWIGIDITHLSIALQKYRLADAFGLQADKDYHVIGEPEDLGSAKQLSLEDRYQFQWWALSLLKARPLGEGRVREGKKGSDRGIDGVISFIDEANGQAKKILVQVKSGKVKSGDVRDLRGVIDREGAAMGVFVTLEQPTREMTTEATSAGFYRSPGWRKDYPKLQIISIEQLLEGAEVKMPPAMTTFKAAKKAQIDSGEEQQSLFE